MMATWDEGDFFFNFLFWGAEEDLHFDDYVIFLNKIKQNGLFLILNSILVNPQNNTLSVPENKRNTFYVLPKAICEGLSSKTDVKEKTSKKPELMWQYFYLGLVNFDLNRIEGESSSRCLRMLLLGQELWRSLLVFKLMWLDLQTPTVQSSSFLMLLVSRDCNYLYKSLWVC